MVRKPKPTRKVLIILASIILICIAILPIWGTAIGILGFIVLRLIKKISTKFTIIGIVLAIIVSLVAFLFMVSLSYTQVGSVHMYAHNLNTGAVYNLGNSSGFNISSYAVLPDSLSVACKGGGVENITSISLNPNYFTISNLSLALPYTLVCDNVSTTFTFDIAAANNAPLNVSVIDMNYSYN